VKLVLVGSGRELEAGYGVRHALVTAPVVS